MENKGAHIVVFGISGSGKTHISTLLAETLKIEFLEGDDFHPNENVEKMKRGHPLTDADRLPWLQLLKSEIRGRIIKNEGFVLSCSALKAKYRDILREAGSLNFVFLEIEEKIVLERLQNRKNHFMPAFLLRSQIETLEAPLENERDIVRLDASQAPEKIIDAILFEVKLQ